MTTNDILNEAVTRVAVDEVGRSRMGLIPETAKAGNMKMMMLLQAFSSATANANSIAHSPRTKMVPRMERAGRGEQGPSQAAKAMPVETLENLVLTLIPQMNYLKN